MLVRTLLLLETPKRYLPWASLDPPTSFWWHRALEHGVIVISGLGEIPVGWGRTTKGPLQPISWEHEVTREKALEEATRERYSGTSLRQNFSYHLYLVNGLACHSDM